MMPSWRSEKGQGGKCPGSGRKLVEVNGLDREPWEDEEEMKVLLIQAPCYHVSCY